MDSLKLSTVTCESHCWSISYIDHKLGHVYDEFGCADSACDESYSTASCYQGDARNSGLACIKCCSTTLCNDAPLNITALTTSRALSCHVTVAYFILYVFVICISLV